jgi:DNA-binding GntR family transcriptional regulator
MTFREVAAAIEVRIKAGEWSLGEKLPTTMDFAEQYGVSEASAYRALVLLVDRGLIRGEPGRGRYIAD